MWDSRKYDTIRGKQAVLFINQLRKGLTPPQTFNGHVNHLRDGGRNGFDTLVNVIHKKNCLNFRVRGQFEIKILIVRHINTKYFKKIFKN